MKKLSKTRQAAIMERRAGIVVPSRRYEVSYSVRGIRFSCIIEAASEEKALASPRVVADVARLRGTDLAARQISAFPAYRAP